MLAGPSGPSESQRQAAVQKVAPAYNPPGVERGVTGKERMFQQSRQFGPGPIKPYHQRNEWAFHAGRRPPSPRYGRTGPNFYTPIRPYIKGAGQVTASGGVEYSKGSLTKERSPYYRENKEKYLRGETKV